MKIESIVENVTINIDGQDVEVPKGINIIEAVKMVGKGKEVPHYCYHPKLTIAGNCRMCMVEMGMPMRDRATGEAVSRRGWHAKNCLDAKADDRLCDERVTRHAYPNRIGDG